MSNHEHFEHLLMKAVDDCLADEERSEFERHLEQCESCREEFAAFRADKALTDALRDRLIAEASDDPIRPSVATRTVNTVGALLGLAASAGLFLAATTLFVTDSSISPLVKVPTLAIFAAGLAVFGNILRLRLKSAKTDPYREIEQ